MTHIRLIIILALTFSLANCEKKTELADCTADAQIVAFHPEKLYCYWGWEIRMGSEIIRADSIPGLKLWIDTIFPINGEITTGAKTRICDKGVDYYEIKEFKRE